MWRATMRPSLAPITRAASTYWFCLAPIAAPRMTRDDPTEISKPTLTMMSTVFGMSWTDLHE